MYGYVIIVKFCNLINQLSGMKRCGVHRAVAPEAIWNIDVQSPADSTAHTTLCTNMEANWITLCHNTSCGITSFVLTLQS